MLRSSERCGRGFAPRRTAWVSLLHAPRSSSPLRDLSSLTSPLISLLIPLYTLATCVARVQFDKFQLTYYEDAGPPFDSLQLTYADSFQARKRPGIA